MLTVRARRLVVLLLTAVVLPGCAAVGTTPAIHALGVPDRAGAFTPVAELPVGRGGSPADRVGTLPVYGYDRSSKATTPSAMSSSGAGRRDHVAVIASSAGAPVRARALATKGVADSATVVRGGVSDVPGAGEVFSGTQGSTLEDAAAGVPDGQSRSTTAGDIRAGGGRVDYAPEYNPRVGQTNYQHVDVCLGPGGCRFGKLFTNPVPKASRFGGPEYTYGQP